MTFRTNASTQAILGSLQILIHSETAPITAEMRFWLSVGLALLQLAISLFAHHANPDGTSARVAYETPRPTIPSDN